MFQRPDQRVAVFIDTQNMYHSAKHLFGGRVNFPAVVAAAVGDRRVIRAIAYVAKSKTGEETAFFEALTQNGIELKTKDVQEFASGQKKADWDVGMAIDAVSLADKVDVVILATGDGDFVPLLHHLQSRGVLCEIVAFDASTNATLKETASSFLDLASDPDLFLIRPRRRAGRSSEEASSEAIDLPSAEEALLLGGNIAPPAPSKPQARPSQHGRPHRGNGSSSSSRSIRVTY